MYLYICFILKDYAHCTQNAWNTLPKRASMHKKQILQCYFMLRLAPGFKCVWNGWYRQYMPWVLKWGTLFCCGRSCEPVEWEDMDERERRTWSLLPQWNEGLGEVPHTLQLLKSRLCLLSLCQCMCRDQFVMNWVGLIILLSSISKVLNS